MQEFLLSINTEHPWTWIPSDTCNCHKSTRYSKSESSSLVYLNQSAELQYLTGYVSGEAINDTFYFKSNQVCHSFLLVDTETDFFWLVSDGYLGLGLDNNKKNPLIEALLHSNLIKQNRFSLFFSKNENLYSSELTFGKYDEGEYSDGNAITVNISGSGWRSRFDSFGLGDLVVNEKLSVLFNPGALGVLGPRKEVEMIYKEVRKTNDCQIISGYLKCFNFTSSKIFLNFTYGVFNFTVPFERLAYLSDNDAVILIGVNDKGYWVLGQPFFKEYFSMFDLKDKTITFYKVLDKKGFSKFLYFVVGVFLLVVICVPILVYWTISMKNPDNELTQSLSSSN